MASFTLFTPNQTPKVAAYCSTDGKPNNVDIGQVKHRFHLINIWLIPPGSRVLEIGCGQGNTMAVLAEIVGSDGHVNAVDPAPGDYGSPWTLGDAQAAP